MTRLICFVTVISFFLFACTGTDNSGKVNVDSLLKVDTLKKNEKKSVNQIILGLGEPIDIVSLIYSEGVPFSAKQVVSPKFSDNLNTSYRRALGLGIIETDFLYLAVNKKSNLSLAQIKAIKSLAEGLQVGHYFDDKQLIEFSKKPELNDSIITLANMGFNKMNKYLLDNNRAAECAMIVTGIWIESLYHASQCIIETPNKKVIEYIGMQKQVMDELYVVLNTFKKEKEYQEIIQNIELIKKEYDGVTIVTTDGETQKIVDENGNITYQSTSVSKVTISNDQLKNISAIVEKIRNVLLNL